MKAEIARLDPHVSNIKSTQIHCPRSKLSAAVSAAALTSRLRLLSLVIGTLLVGSAWAPAAYAACASPSGAAGEMIYNTDYNVVQFCDSTNWISMSGTVSTNTDPRLGALTASKWCAVDAGGTTVVCDQNAPSGGTPAGTVAGAVQFRGSSAVFAADDANLVWDDTNKRLGIGAVAPKEVLEVAGAIRSTSNAVDFSSADGINIDYYPGASVGRIAARKASGGADLSLLTGTTPTERMRILSSGNVGIGTASPGVALDVVGTIRGYDLYTASGYTFRSLGAAYLDAASGQPVIFRPNGSTEAMRILSSGNVGIGTAVPTNKLTVDGGIEFSAGAFSAGGSGSGLWMPGTGELGLVAGGATAVRINTSGNVGIGTTGPVSKLDVAGGARVGGDAVCNDTKAGMLAWNSSTLQVCVSTASGFVTVASAGGSGATSSGAAGLVQLSGGSGAFASDTGFSYDTTSKALTLGGGTLTTSNPVINATQTWNAAGVTFTGVKENITNTASAAASKLMDLQVWGTSAFSVDKSGNVTYGIGASGVLIAGTSTAQISRFNGQTFGFGNTSGVIGASAGLSGLAAAVSSYIGFSPNANLSAVPTPDTMFTRQGAANMHLGAADAAAPIAQTLGVVAGTTDTAGSAFTIAGSQGTGTGLGGVIQFKTAPAAGSTASTQNALATAMTILGNGNVGIGTTNPQTKLAVSDGTNGIEVSPGSTNILQSVARPGGAYDDLSIKGRDIIFTANNVEAMRLQELHRQRRHRHDEPVLPSARHRHHPAAKYCRWKRWNRVLSRERGKTGDFICSGRLFRAAGGKRRTHVV